MSIAGNRPKDLGLIDISPSEMLFWMYLPISVPGSSTYRLPENLYQFGEIVSAVKEAEPTAFHERYVYLTAKTLWVVGEYIGNRPGWHIDGYGTDDLNFIWADRAPTQFLFQQSHWILSDDCDESLRQMEKIGRYAEAFGHVGLQTFPDKHLLRLDNTVMHRSPVGFEPGMRSFAKVSLSHAQYNLKGNSVNPLLPETKWPLVDRQETRNHPAKES